MNFLKNKINRYPLGIWIAIVALILVFLAWIMQAYSLLDWEAAVDLVWALPLTIIAFIGLLRKKFIGFITAMMVFAICVYFPMFYLFRESMDTETAMTAVFLWGVPSLLGIIGLWNNIAYFSSN